jgi:hypothetical protein
VDRRQQQYHHILACTPSPVTRSRTAPSSSQTVRLCR